MRENTSSRTASQNALFRALDARRGQGHTVAGDTLAERFLPAEFRIVSVASAVPPVRSAVEHFIDWRWPCARGGVVARTRVIDDAVTALLAEASQVVLLGAGFDSRAYRLPGMRTLPVFEVDHPATQAAKRRGLRRAGMLDGQDVRFVPVLFGIDDAGAALKAAGFDPERRTLVIWEGVTNYLSADAVDQTFRLLARMLSAGSSVFFTYVHRGMLDGTTDFEGASTTMRAVSHVGEPFTFGFEPSEIMAYLSERGFEKIWDTSVADAGSGLDKGRHTRLPAYYHLVEARRS
jgi:methyltransferase (TIGR00027 family)